MIQDPIAKEVAAALMAEARAGKREKIDVDDVIEALRKRPDTPQRRTQAFENLLMATLRQLVTLT